MRVIVAIARSLILLFIFAFCVFGFLATFEPTGSPGTFLAFRIGYAAVGFGCLGGLVALTIRRMRKE
ncbi:MAG: hypothetical protein CMJ70_19570 [Planctomycetaceae bacterium]|nr:hypothetical protein [Planctomycetaceae bacterium]HAA68612.1 hypothetical protein [Planctomycetaceae bacterium]|tara:strand:- start:649 stop:849 length:201 start_codon:yes stop_codon:yes gene_type:complete